MEALVSIIVPVYNSEAYIEKCAESILNQTYPYIELILMDDESTDNSPQILNKIEERTHGTKTVKVYRHKNRGPGLTRNAGIEKATGDYLMFADNDDVMAEDYVETMVKCIKEKDADMIVSGFKRIDEMGKILYEYRLDDTVWSKLRVVAPWGKIMRRKFVLEHELSFGKFLIGEDSFFTVTACNSSEKIYTTDYVGYYWVDRPASVSNTLQKEGKTDILPLLNAIVERNPERKYLSEEMFEYFLIKTIAGDLFHAAEKTDLLILDNYCEKWYQWLQDFCPDYRKNLWISPFRPKGEMLSVRIIVWMMTKFSDKMRRHLLHFYKKIKH